LLPSYLSNGVAHILVDGVGHLCSLHTAAKLHVKDTWVVSQPPVISLVTRQPCAVDTRLLTSTNTNNLRDMDDGRVIRKPDALIRLSARSYLSIFSIADRVGLSVLDSDGGHCEVTHSFLRQLAEKQCKKIVY